MAPIRTRATAELLNMWTRFYEVQSLASYQSNSVAPQIAGEFEGREGAWADDPRIDPGSR
jgi:hypothetical protein